MVLFTCSFQQYTISGVKRMWNQRDGDVHQHNSFDGIDIIFGYIGLMLVILFVLFIFTKAT